MKVFLILLSAMAVSLGSARTFADDAPGIPGEIIKELDWLTGTWKAEGSVGDEMQTGWITLRWAPTRDDKKVCLIGRFSYTTGGETRSGVTLIGWNAAKRCIEDRGFDDLGGNGRLYWFVESDKKWRGEIVHVVDGETVGAKADLIKTDSGGVIESVTDDGKVSRVVYKKVERKRAKE